MRIAVLRKQLVEGMQISRGGFTERTHLITSPHLTSIQNVANDPFVVADWCDCIAPEAFLSKVAPLFTDKIRSLDLTESVDINYQRLLREITYPERSSSLYALLCSLATTTQLHGIQLNSALTSNSLLDNAYFSNSYWHEDLDSMMSVSIRWLRQGFRMVKHHVGVLSPIEEAERCNTLVGGLVEMFPYSSHCLDLNCAYTYEEAETFLKYLSPSLVKHILWIEEPLHFTIYSLLGRLQANTCFPIAAGENALGVRELERLTQEIAYTMPDLGRNCDPFNLTALLASAMVSNTKITLHNYGSLFLLSKTLKAYQRNQLLSHLELDLSSNPLIPPYSEQVDSPRSWISRLFLTETLDIDDSWSFEVIL